MRKTIRNVTIVVPVLMASCQVSLYRKNGPVTSQASITATAPAKVRGRPASRAGALADRAHQETPSRKWSNRGQVEEECSWVGTFIALLRIAQYCYQPRSNSREFAAP